jgi:hypothetical protein
VVLAAKWGQTANDILPLKMVHFMPSKELTAGMDAEVEILSACAATRSEIRWRVLYSDHAT